MSISSCLINPFIESPTPTPSPSPTGSLNGRAVEAIKPNPDYAAIPTISKTHKKSLTIFNVIRGIVFFVPIMIVAVPLQLTIWGLQVLAKPFTGSELEIVKSFKFALTSLVGCDGKKILGLENAYGQTYRRMDRIVTGSDGLGSITLGSIPTGMTLGSILHELGDADRGYIIDLTEKEERVSTLWGTPVTKAEWEEKGSTYVNHPAKDLVPLELELVSKVVEEMHDAVLKGQNIYIHCKAGVGRSATILAAYLTKYGVDGKTQMSATDALNYIEEKRFINLSKEQAAKVHEFAAVSTLLNLTTPDKETIHDQLSQAIDYNNTDFLSHLSLAYLKTAIDAGNFSKEAHGSTEATPKKSPLQSNLNAIRKMLSPD